MGYNEEKCHLSALDSGATGISAKDLTTATVATIVGMAFSVLVAAAYRIRLKYFTTLEQHTNQVFMKELAVGGFAGGSALGKTSSSGSASGRTPSVASMSGPRTRDSGAATPSTWGETDRKKSVGSFA